MPTIFETDVVKYACTCGLLKPLAHLYFCRHCSQLRCGFCVCHEVDSTFCGKCCENLPSTEARLKKNKCGNCRICPSCHQELATRAVSKQPANTEDAKATPKKMYHLSCFFCRWNSRDIGIPDQTAATGGWPERENIHSNRLLEVIDMYKGIILSEKQQAEIFAKKQRGKYISYTDKTGITAASLRKRIGFPEDVPLHKNAPKKVPPATADEQVEDLPESIFVEPVNLIEVTTIKQRLLQPDSQPINVNNLFPIHKQLSVKRSLRCRACEHNVSKPEYNPSSVKFKIQLFAYYHIPEIKIVTVEPLRAGKSSELIIKFTNPSQHQTVVSFLSYDTEIEEEKVEDKTEQPPSIPDNQAKFPSLGSQPSSLFSLTSRQPSCTVTPRSIIANINADVEIPSSNFILPPRDDAAEYDDFNDTQNIQDDPKLVVWRKSNKAYIKLNVTPKEDLPLDSEVFVGFVMSHLYTNTIATTVENKGPLKFDHKVKIVLKLGKSVGSD